MRRLSDRRVRHFWDPDHLVAKRMARDARPPQPNPRCCYSDGILWDLAAVYPRGSVWQNVSPVATVFDGPVFDLTAPIDSSLQ